MGKKALVCGAGGFIGSHLVTALLNEGYETVDGADLKYPEFSKSKATNMMIRDLRDYESVRGLMRPYDEVYQLAADMGGAGFVFTGDNDADILHNNALINLNVLKAAAEREVGRIFFSSSACVYPEYNQLDPNAPVCREDTAYPAAPDSDYGFEKLFSERLYLAFARNKNIQVRIARYHNIFGPEGTWEGGREKAPAALCRKVASAPDGGEIEIWGDGEQTRSFLYITDCIEGTMKLMNSPFVGPVNIGSEEMVSINRMAEIIMAIAGKKLSIKHIEGPLGVRGRNSDNHLAIKEVGWSPRISLAEGLEPTYRWILQQI